MPNSSKHIHAAFLQRFNARKPSSPIALTDLADTERRLGVVLPADLAILYQMNDGCWTPSILDIIVDNEIDMHDIQQIYQMSELTILINPSLGEVLPFGSDCIGNEFLFTVNDLKSGNSAKVYIYDKGLDEAEEVSPSFRELIATYMNLPLSESSSH